LQGLEQASARLATEMLGEGGHVGIATNSRAAAPGLHPPGIKPTFTNGRSRRGHAAAARRSF
jgi:hypothetical protein